MQIIIILILVVNSREVSKNFECWLITFLSTFEPPFKSRKNLLKFVWTEFVIRFTYNR